MLKQTMTRTATAEAIFDANSDAETMRMAQTAMPRQFMTQTATAEAIF